MMKILYILHSTDTTAGSTKAIMPLLTHPAEGIRPVVVLPDTNGIYDSLTKLGIKTYVFPFRTSAYPTPLCSWKDWLLFIPRCIVRIYLNTKAYNQSLRIIKEEQIDIVHTNTGVIRFGWHAASKMHIPHVWHLREYAEKIGYYHFPSNAAHLKELKQSYTICITIDIKNHYHLADEKSSYVIYDGVLSQKQTLPFISKDKYFLYAGRIEAPKGVEDLLHAYAAYVNATHFPIPLWLVGTCEASYKQHIQNEMMRLNITQYVHLKGFRTDIQSLLQKAYSVIIPSLTEGFGFVMTETQFAGSLAIVREIQGLKEQLDLGALSTGKPTAVSFTSQTELTQHLLEIAEQGIEKFEPVIRNGQEFASTHFSIENNIKQITELYLTIGNHRQ